MELKDKVVIFDDIYSTLLKKYLAGKIFLLKETLCNQLFETIKVVL